MSSHEMNPFAFENSSYAQRKSFDRRFGDDLCEEILQFLPWESKVKLECVSQQFKRLIYRKQYTLQLEIISRSRFNNEIEERKFFSQGRKFYRRLIKKCVNVEEIRFSFIPSLCLREEGDSERSIFKKLQTCRKIVKLDKLKHSARDLVLWNLPNNFARQINDLQSRPHHNAMLNHFPNLESTYIITPRKLNEVNLPKLTKLGFSVSHADNLIECFINLKQREQITHLKLVDYSNTNDAIFMSMVSFPVMNNLRHLRVSLQRTDGEAAEDSWTLTAEQFMESMKHLSKQGPRIESLLFGKQKNSVSFPIIMDPLPIFPDMIRGLATFKNLRSLSLELVKFPEIDTFTDEEIKEIFSFKHFEALTKVEWLSLVFRTERIFCLSFFLDLNTALPHLRHLTIGHRIRLTHENINDFTDMLSGMKALQSIGIKCVGSEYSAYLRQRIVAKCRKIQFIKVEEESNWVD